MCITIEIHISFFYTAYVKIRNTLSKTNVFIISYFKADTSFLKYRRDSILIKGRFKF